MYGNLVLTRNPQEEIVLELPDGREIVVANAGKERTKLAIDAPKDVRIRRRELIGGPVKQAA